MNTTQDPLAAVVAGTHTMLSTIPYTIPLLPRLNSTLLASMTPTSPSYPIYHSAKTNIVPFFSDHWLALISPIVVYWVLSLAFHVLDVAQIPYFESKRIHESQEVLSRNKASVMQVINAVVLQQVIQTILGYFVMDVEETAHQLVWKDHMQEMEKLTGVVGQAVVLVLGDRTGKSLLMNYGKELVSWTYWWGIPLVQFYLAFFIIDTWQYFLHRAFHTSRFLYRHFHSVHHRLYVPFAFGALYNHPVEGLLLDSLGAVIAERLSFMTVRQAALLFALSSAKTVDDHCGYRIWWDPCQFLFYNNVDYHDIHHQSYGIKKNFSQPFFTNWDDLLGTKMTREQAANRFNKSAQNGQKAKTATVLKVTKIE